MKTPKFKVGDVVRLKSETKKMTVEKVLMNTDFNGYETFDGYYQCVWIDKEQMIGNFLEETLTSDD